MVSVTENTPRKGSSGSAGKNSAPRWRESAEGVEEPRARTKSMSWVARGTPHAETANPPIRAYCCSSPLVCASSRRRMMSVSAWPNTRGVARNRRPTTVAPTATAAQEITVSPHRVVAWPEVPQADYAAAKNWREKRGSNESCPNCTRPCQNTKGLIGEAVTPRGVAPSTGACPRLQS